MKNLLKRIAEFFIQEDPRPWELRRLEYLAKQYDDMFMANAKMCEHLVKMKEQCARLTGDDFIAGQKLITSTERLIDASFQRAQSVKVMIAALEATTALSKMKFDAKAIDEAIKYTDECFVTISKSLQIPDVQKPGS